MYESKRTLVLGASPKPERYSNMAISLLRKHQIEVLAVGLREGRVEDVPIRTDINLSEEVHTLTMYLGVKNQMAYYDQIFQLNPKRVIFNPGTENADFARQLEERNITVLENCTLVMLNSGIY